MSPNTFLIRFFAPVLLIGESFGRHALSLPSFVAFFRIPAKTQSRRNGKTGDSHPSFHAKKCGPGLSDPHCQHIVTRQKSLNPASFARNSKPDPERSGDGQPPGA
ncbi:hypothetical protein [Sphingobium sp. HWE2-09]|uniref:hypothetical protein n=1 Tax=Sphingobium sp. HWE2-09 TaxID=3108390 RepID=UPI002DCFC358|nr:hypothetical protein [Sphingobium sp. HWE2-09]